MGPSEARSPNGASLGHIFLGACSAPFRLPPPRACPPSRSGRVPKPSAPDILSPMHILVIEDNPDIAANIGDFLADKGHIVEYQVNMMVTFVLED